MKIILSFLILTFLISCAVKRNENSFKKVYINEFKFFYFRNCLKNGFNNSVEINKLLIFDKSGYGEYILGNGYVMIDSLTKINEQKMKLDSLNSIGRVAEGTEGKKVLSTCLCNYNSKWLDSIAKSEFKKMEKK